MQIVGTPKANAFIVRALLEHECQFLIRYKMGRAIRVAFHEGTWRLMRENGDFFDFYDTNEVTGGNNDMLQAMVSEIAKHSSSGFEEFRQRPAWIMARAIAVWGGPSEEIETIEVTQACRDGWFESFLEVA